MTKLIAMLALHYACNMTATQAILPTSDAAVCSHNFATIKTQFLTKNERSALIGASTADRHDLMQLGYLRFKAFETDNPNIVADAKAIMGGAV